MWPFTKREQSAVRTDDEYRAEIAALKTEIDGLGDEKRAIKEELEDLKLEKKISEEDIKHMVKLSEERQEVENERYQMKCEREKEEAIAKVKDEYRDKLEGFLKNQVKDTKQMYEAILKRIPDVNVALSGDVGKHPSSSD